MPHHDHDITRVSGQITEIFAHRFVIKTTSATILADLTPHGAEAVELHIGDEVTIEGEQKPSEIKVSKLERDQHTYVIAHAEKPPRPHKDKHSPKHKPHHHHEHDVDPKIATRAAKAAGYEVLGEVRRKPKHFEVLGVKGKKIEELHIELDGDIRKAKAVKRDDAKWSIEISAIH